MDDLTFLKQYINAQVLELQLRSEENAQRYIKTNSRVHQQAAKTYAANTLRLKGIAMRIKIEGATNG